MANPFTAAQAPSQVNPAMQLVAPELIAQQMKIARMQQIAQQLQAQGSKEMGPTEMVSGWAVKRNPIEGISKVLQSALGGYLGRKSLEDMTDVQSRFANKLRSTADGIPETSISQTAAQIPGISEASLEPGTSVGAATQDNAALQAPSANVGITQQQKMQLMATKLLYGEEAAKVMADRLTEANSVKEARQMGISPGELQQFYRAKQLKEGTQSFQPGQLNILPTGQRIVAPDFKEGIAGGFDAQGNPVVNAIPGATAAAAARAGAISGAQEGAKLLPLDYSTPGGGPIGGTVGEYLGGSQAPAAAMPGAAPSQGMANVMYSDIDRKNGFPIGTMAAIQQVESGGNPNAVSPKGAQGLFQMMPGTQAQPGFGLSPLNPNSAEDAAKYLGAMRNQAGGDMNKAIAMYNAGPVGKLDNPETTAYVKKVTGLIPQMGNQAAPEQGRPRLSSAAEKQASLDAQKLESAPALAKKTKDFEVASEREASLSNNLAKSTDLIKRVNITEDALREYKVGGGSEVRVKLATVAQGLGAPQDVVDKIAGGDLGAANVVQKMAIQESLLQMQQALASDSGAQQRSNQMIMEAFMKANPHLDTDPRGFEKLLNVMKDYHRSKLDESNEYFKYKSSGKDITAWPNYWANKLEESGKLDLKPAKDFPYASRAGQPAATSKANSQPMTAERWAAMKSGDTFVDAQGNTRRKP